MSGNRHDLSSVKTALVGDRAFYAMVLSILIPIIIQNAITNFVNLLDNVMVGQVGTEQMTGVSVANQLIFVFNLFVFGCISGPGIFSAQFHGAGNREGVQYCFRYKLYACILLLLTAFGILLPGGSFLITRFLHEEGNAERVAATLSHGMAYLHIILWGLPPFAVSQAYSGTLRETGETRLPMLAGITAVFVNLLFNYLLIFGHLGFPKLGVRGAAIATVISRYVELAIVVTAVHSRPNAFPFAKGLYGSMRLPAALARDITKKGLPLVANEGLWSLGMTVLAQCYSVRGLDVVAAMNISNTISNVFAVAFLSMGSATAIIIGQTLGSNDLEQARLQARRLIAFALFISLLTIIVMLAVAPLIPQLYQTSPQVRHLATRLLEIYALCTPMFAFCNTADFTLRSGGKTMITFLFDSGFTWVVCVPLAWSLVHLTSLSVVMIYLLVQLADIIKCVFGYVLLRKGIWLNNMVA